MAQMTSETAAYLNSRVCIDYNAARAAKAAEAVRLQKMFERACAAILRARFGTFGADRVARARLHIAAERRDHFFQLQCWGYDAGLVERRAAVVAYVQFLREQARRSRAERRKAA